MPRSFNMQMDPINSPHPVPWNWIQAVHGAAAEAGNRQTRYYRSASLRSPDGQWMAYSRICLEAAPLLHNSRATSILFVENIETGELQGVQPPAPLMSPLDTEPEIQAQAGAMSLLIPIAWDREGTQLLVRDFEGVFCSSLASDYAVVWDSTTGHSRTVAPYNAAYEYAILQGWSKSHPKQVLFKTAQLGEPHQPLWRVDSQGRAMPSALDEAEGFGQTMAEELEGPQVVMA